MGEGLRVGVVPAAGAVLAPHARLFGIPGSLRLDSRDLESRHGEFVPRVSIRTADCPEFAGLHGAGALGPLPTARVVLDLGG